MHPAIHQMPSCEGTAADDRMLQTSEHERHCDAGANPFAGHVAPNCTGMCGMICEASVADRRSLGGCTITSGRAGARTRPSWSTACL